MGGVTASQFAIAFAPNLEVLLILRFLAGVAGGVALTAGTVLVAVLADEERRGHALSVMQGVQLSASGLGPALGGLVAALFGNRAPFLACGLFAIVVCLVGGRTLIAVPRARMQQDSTETKTTTPAVSTWRLLTDRSYLAACCVGFSIFLHRFGGVQSIVPLIGYTVIGISVAHMGVLLGLVTLLNFALLPLVGGMSDRRGRKRVIVPGILIASVTFPLYAANDSVWLFTLVTLIAGVAMSVSAPVPSGTSSTSRLPRPAAAPWASTARAAISQL
jgi:predicted MFS family arabinose efflux permease